MHQQQGINSQRPSIIYSDRYSDDDYEYRHVILPVDLAKIIPKAHLLTETEWRNLGIQQSPGWIHYMYHQPAKNHPVPSDFGRHPHNDPNYQDQEMIEN
uniref:Cyclin-dependent kinases regulatory subunit n=1 Tax=Brachionus calyciflorus TaxID=104777 RepID=M4SMI8_9BILA|nr:CksA [Brachionus calyciflorus]